MKKKLFLTAVILIGIGSVYGARHWMAPRSSGKMAVPPHLERAAALRATLKDQGEASTVDPLEAKIEKLRRWTRGEEPKMDRWIAMQILEEWSKRDAQAALDFVCEAAHFPRRNMAYAVPLAWICRRDPKAALTWLVRQVQVEGDRNEVARTVVRRLEDDAPGAALEFVTITGVPFDIELYGALVGRVARTQPQTALQALAQKPLEMQQKALGSMLLSWAQSCPNEALAWYLSRGAADVDGARALATGCMKSGQFSLGDLISRLKISPKQTDEMLWRLRREGVALDAKTLGLFSPSARIYAAEAAGRELEEAPAKTLAFVVAAVGPEHRAEALVQGWSCWLQSDRKAALEWLQQLPDRQLAAELSGRLERMELTRDPRQALSVATTITNQEERHELVGTAVRRLSWEDPAMVAAWMAQNPNDVPQTISYGALARRYLERDDAGAMLWIAGLGTGEARDEALSAAASFWVRKEIDFATTAMAVIGDAQKRQQCMFSLYCNLNRSNAAKADQWLAAQGLSAEVRQSWKALGQTTSDHFCE